MGPPGVEGHGRQHPTPTLAKSVEIPLCKTPSRDCLETPNRLHYRVPRACRTGRMSALSGVWCHQNTRDPTRKATFQTVSLRSTLAIWMASRRQRSRVPWVLLRLFSGRCAQPTREKVWYPSWECLPPTTNGNRHPKGVWPPAYGLENPQRSPFRSAVSFERSVGGESSMGPLREDGRGAYPSLFASKWLKSSSETV